jgi:hypothetical protein
MLRYILVVAALQVPAGGASAEETISNQQECFTIVDALAQNWDNHKYANKAESEKIGAALSNLEALCQGNKFAEAQKSAADLKVMIAK